MENVPPNATVLVTDWEATMNPVSLVSTLASELLGSSERAPGDWEITDRVVEVDAINLGLLRQVARDPAVVEAFENCHGELHNPAAEKWRHLFPSREPRPIHSLRTRDDDLGDTTIVGTSGIPVLLGMIIEAATLNPVTYHAHELWLRQWEEIARKQAAGPGGEPNA